MWYQCDTLTQANHNHILKHQIWMKIFLKQFASQTEVSEVFRGGHWNTPSDSHSSMSDEVKKVNFNLQYS